MKKVMAFVLITVMVFSFAGCGKVSLNAGATGSVVYRINDISFEDALTDDEVAAVVEILDGKKQDSVLEGVPSCGFSSDVSIVIGGKRFALACDKCGILQNCSNGSFIRVSDEERVVLEEIFTSRGGEFPCI